jgi:6-phosphofructokinase 1
LGLQGRGREPGSSPADRCWCCSHGRRIGNIRRRARLADPDREIPLLIFLSESGITLAEIADR